ncbi:MAG: T9SS type A sorting domain-containing protein [candidate division KSB1 bacterium]|nr:T9SS type A sorting domain-containing protein [candidate division KSB1 bacterium]
MKKLIIFSIAMSICLLTTVQAQNAHSTVFADNFDSYTAGTFPSSGGWYLRYNGAGNSYQVVVNSHSHSGSQSMQMKGAPGWTAQMEKSVTVQRHVIYWQAWVLPTGNDGGLGLINTNIPTTGNYGTVYFDFGKIYCQVGYDLNVEIDDFTPNQWYKIKVRYDHITKCIDVWINDIQKITRLQATNIYGDYYNAFYLFSEHDGNLYYFDDLELWYEENSDGLVAYYPFNGNANDESGNGNDGTVYGAMLTSDRLGRPQSAYEFDGIDDYILVPSSSSMNLRDSLTICAWVSFPTIPPGGSHILMKSDYPDTYEYGLNLNLYNNGAISASIGGFNVVNVEGNPVNTNTWYHIVATWQYPGLCKLYVNGELVNSVATSGNIDPHNCEFTMGRIRPETSGSSYQGIIDEVRLYRRVLSEAEVQQLYLEDGTPVELSSFTAEIGAGLVTLKWTTQSETENYGFQLYRSRSKDRDYQQITRTLIPGAGNSSQVHHYSFVDRDVMMGETYYYKLADVDFSGTIKFHGPIIVTLTAHPSGYLLEQNYPNPFNPTTTIAFSIRESGHVSLKIYDLQGKIVKTLIDGFSTAGAYRLSWDGTDHHGQKVVSGNYICVLKAGQFEQQRKMTFIK